MRESQIGSLTGENTNKGQKSSCVCNYKHSHRANYIMQGRCRNASAQREEFQFSPRETRRGRGSKKFHITKMMFFGVFCSTPLARLFVVVTCRELMILRRRRSLTSICLPFSVLLLGAQHHFITHSIVRGRDKNGPELDQKMELWPYTDVRGHGQVQVCIDF